MKKHFGYLLYIGASVADVNQRKAMLDTEQDRGMLDMYGSCQRYLGCDGGWILNCWWVYIPTSGFMRWVGDRSNQNCRVLQLS